MLSKRAHSNRNQVQQMLHLSDARYNELVYTEGIRYLELYMGDDAAGRAILEALPSYWSWWKHQWARLDADFIAHLEDMDVSLIQDAWGRVLARELYDVIHDGTLLVHRRICRRVMLEAVGVINRTPR